MANSTRPPLNYDPHTLPRELKRHYISATDAEIDEMLKSVGAGSFDDLYAHIPAADRFAEAPELPEELDYDALQERMAALAAENQINESFLGDGLPHYAVTPVVGPVC
jgi:glycine cleavage system pyridoxal-binding protein P